MSKAKLFGISVAVATMTAIPAFAQTGGSPATSRPSTSAPSGAPASRALPSDIKSMKASELIGKNVYSSSDERIGEVDDVVTSKSGNATMAVIGVGGFLGIGEKKAAVPVDQLSVQGDKIVASGLTKESLKAQGEYKSADYDKYDRERTVGEATPSGTGGTSGSGTTGSGSTGSSGATGSGSSSPPSGSSGMGAPTGSSTSPSTAPSNAPPASSGSSGTGSSSGSSGETPKQ